MLTPTFPLYVFTPVGVQSEIPCKESAMTMHYQTRQIPRFIHLFCLHILNTTQGMKYYMACKEL